MTSRTLAVMVLVLASACSHWDSGVSPDEVQIGNGKPVSYLPAPPFPELSKPGTIYVELTPAPEFTPGLHSASRYVLYDDGTFGLQTSSALQQYEFSGRYTRADSLVTFDWDGWSAAGPWKASAIMRGDQLIVTYGEIMTMTDFVDATYVRLDNW